VEGPACKTIKAQGLLIKMASPAPWISDPTATGARGRGGPRREPGVRVHGGPPRLNEGVRDPGHPREIERPRTRASEGGGGVAGERRRAAGARRCWPWTALRPPLRPRVGAKRSAGACARDQGVRGCDRASPAVGTGRGQRGCSGELAGTLLCVKGREIGRGLMLTVQR
jgi:hypothetical protein